jgi:hypothetical protein
VVGVQSTSGCSHRTRGVTKLAEAEMKRPRDKLSGHACYRRWDTMKGCPMRIVAKRIGIVAMAVLAMALSAGTAAHADYPTALNVKTQYLALPVSGLATESVSQTIYLAGGDYGFFNYVSPNAIIPRGHTCGSFTGELAGNAKYSWSSITTPHNGYYTTESQLWNQSTGGLRVITCDWTIPQEGEYTWGSALDPHF